MAYRAVIFDLGGVVLDSPLAIIADYERELGVAPGAVNRVVAETGPEGAWSRLERGELPIGEFYPLFDAECREAGHVLSAQEMMRRIARARPRPVMLDAIARLRRTGLRVAALTNNWKGEGEPTGTLRAHFDRFVESAVVGMRKPDPRIYHHVCAELGVEPAEAVFLDDIGRNLKAARALGFATIKVEEPERALRTLGALLDMELA